MGPEKADAFLQYLKDGAKIQVIFPEDGCPEGLCQLLDLKGAELDELSRRRVTAVLGNKERTRFGQHNSFSFTVAGMMWGAREHFRLRLAPLLTALIVLEAAPA
jgi:hypothetical protein